MSDLVQMNPGQRKALSHAARDLHTKFQGVFGSETIEALVFDSFQTLAARATITDWLVIGAENFARQRLEALVQAEDHSTKKLPAVLFLCVHNSGRSQMALGWFTHFAGDRAIAWSGGSEPGSQINTNVVAAMAEIGIDISREFPKPWTEQIRGGGRRRGDDGVRRRLSTRARQALRRLGVPRPHGEVNRRDPPHPR